jgi:hypothetical protein
VLKEIGPVGSGIYFGQLFSKRLASAFMEQLDKLESNIPSETDKNKFKTYSVNESATVSGFLLTSVLGSIYSRLTNQYSLMTGIKLVIPSFPNPGFVIKTQMTGQIHGVHSDGNNLDYEGSRVLHTSAICMNDNYEGGHTQFYLSGTMEKPNIDIDIKLKAGQALIFNSNLNYHGITEVTSGSRITLLQLWREWL